MDVTYTLTLTITRPVRPDRDEKLQDAAEGMITVETTRILEKEVVRTLRTIDGDCDCEVLETTIQRSPEDDQERTIADGGHDTWAEYRGER